MTVPEKGAGYTKNPKIATSFFRGSAKQHDEKGGHYVNAHMIERTLHSCHRIFDFPSGVLLLGLLNILEFLSSISLLQLLVVETIGQSKSSNNYLQLSFVIGKQPLIRLLRLCGNFFTGLVGWHMACLPGDCCVTNYPHLFKRSVKIDKAI